MSKYLIACSGGPDSMALLDMYKNQDIVVGHVNYHHRDSADRDENIVSSFCEKYHIPFYKADYEEKKGNFQDNARVFRYGFFSSLVKELALDGVLVAHHRDDFLETYILQKQRGSVPSFYGLKEETVIMDVPVKRPLLGYTKKQLEEYCLANNVPYGIDESNLSDDYNRNYIRHHELSFLSEEEKETMLDQIDKENHLLSEKRKDALSFLNGRTDIDEKEFLTYKDLDTLLRIAIKEDLSAAQISELIRQLKLCGHLIYETYCKCLEQEYGRIYLYTKNEDYCFSFPELVYGDYQFFSFAGEGKKIESLRVEEADFPLTVRNFKDGDQIRMRFGHKKLSRFFIDRKIPGHQRESWPVVLNKDGKIIFVPGLGCDAAHYSIHPNLFVIK